MSEPTVIVLNGGSSAGKSTIAMRLQAILPPPPWMRFGVDDLVAALPAAMTQTADGLELAADGQVTPGIYFREAEAAWTAGLAAMARHGARLIIDDVHLSGRESQERLRAQLEGLDVLWVGVRCDPETAARREAGRPDRIPGMAAAQAETVHDGVRYDVEVNTAHAEPLQCARAIAAHVI